MVMAKGSKGQLVLDYETTYGTSASPVAGIGPMPFNRCTVDASRNINSAETITGDLNPVQPFAGNTDVAGDIVIPVDLTIIGAWFRALFGAASSVVTGSKSAEAVVCEADDDKITLSTHGLLDGQGITLTADVMPTGLVAGTVYYLVSKDTNTFKLATTPGGTAIDFTTDGTAVKITTVCAHVWKMGTAMPSITLEKGFTDITQYMLFNGCKIGSFGIDLGGDGELVATLGVKGAKVTASAVAYDASLTTPGTLNRVNNFQAALQEGGSTFAKATKMGIKVDFDLDDSIFCIGNNGIRGDLPQGIGKVSGTVEALFEDLTLLNKAINRTESSIKATLTSGTSSLEFLLPEVEYAVKTPAIEGPKGVLQMLDYVGYKNNANEATAIQVTLINARNTAY
jgi:hypothetical protein